MHDKGGRQAGSRDQDALRVLRTAQPGDLVLTGADDPISRLIQLVLDTRYSHAAIVHEPGRVLEAYDRNLLRRDTDEGVFSIPMERVIDRADHGLTAIAILEPRDLHASSMTATAVDACAANPPFSTIAAALIGVHLLAERGAAAIDRERDLAELVADRWVDYLGDGPKRMSCGEFAAWFYSDAGLNLDFGAPRLGQLIARMDDVEVVDGRIVLGRRILPTASAPPTAGGFLERARQIISGFGYNEDDEADAFDLIMPPDFLTSNQFTLTRAVVLTDDGWRPDPDPR